MATSKVAHICIMSLADSRSSTFPATVSNASLLLMYNAQTLDADASYHSLSLTLSHAHVTNFMSLDEHSMCNLLWVILRQLSFRVLLNDSLITTPLIR